MTISAALNRPRIMMCACIRTFGMKKKDIDDHFETDRLRQALKLYMKKPENGGMKKSR